MIVVVTVARRREKDTGDRIGAHEHVHAPLGFRKGWDTLSSRPVNSSFRSSFLPFSLSLSLSLFFLSCFLSFVRSLVRSLCVPLSLRCLAYTRPISCGMARRRSQNFRGTLPKRKIRSPFSRATFFSALCGETQSFKARNVRFAVVVAKRIAINGEYL